MVEPTESEDQGRARSVLRRDDSDPRGDRGGGRAARRIAKDNVLKNAPHTAAAVTASQLDASVLARAGGVSAAVGQGAASSGRASGASTIRTATGTCSAPVRRSSNANSQRRADARGRPLHDRRDRHPVARADGERRPPGGGGDGGGLRVAARRRAWPCCAAAATTAATASSSRGRCCSAASIRRCSSSARSRRSAATRGRTSTFSAASASPSSRSTTSRAGSCTSPRSRQCTLIVDAIFGTGLQARRWPACSRRSSPTSTPPTFRSSSIDLPSGMSADTPHLIGDCIDASMTVTLAAPKLPLVLPPGRGPCRRRGDRRHRHSARSDRRPRRTAHRAADAGAAAGAGRSRARPIRTRATSAVLTMVAGSHGQDRRGLSRGDGRAALRRRPRDGGDAGSRVCRSWPRWRRSS